MSFEIHSKVVATKKIWNQKGTVLNPGEFAVVRSRFPSDSQTPSVIDLTLDDGRILIDIALPEQCLQQV